MAKKEFIEIKKSNLSKMSSIVIGFKAPFEAISFTKANKGLKKFFFIPFILNIFILTLIFYFSFTSLHSFLLGIIPSGDSLIEIIIRGILGPMLFVIIALLTVFLYSIMGGIVSAPFHDPLSVKVEEILNSKVDDYPFSFQSMIDDIVRVTKNISKLFLLVLLFNIFILGLNFLQPIGSFLYSILSFISLVFFFGFQFFDFVLERRRLSFNNKLKIVLKYKYITIGVGFSFFILSLIPIFGFMSLALGTVGVTKLYIELIDSNIKISYANNDNEK